MRSVSILTAAVLVILVTVPSAFAAGRWEGTSHFAMLQDPKGCTDAVRDFLSE